MIAILTQTYGNDRRELYEIRQKNSLLHYFISQFDINIYSFHNSSKETIDFFKSTNNNPNTIYFEYNNVSYPNCIFNLIEELRKMGCEKLIFLQDDVFTFNKSKEELDILIDYIKNGKYYLLNMEMEFKDFNQNIQNNKKIIYSKDNINIYNTFTKDFFDNGAYSFDDAPFVIDFNLINLLFDNNFFQMPDVWNAELYSNEKFKLLNIPRYTTNKMFFKRYNILGRNNWNRAQEFVWLEENIFNTTNSNISDTPKNLCSEVCTSPCDWHKLELGFVINNLNSSDYVVDLGAYTGEYLSVLINIVPPSQIIGVEMDVYNYNNLVRNYSDKGIKLINCAISDKNEKISYYSGNGGCPNIFGQHENNSFVGYKIGEVESYTLDSLFKDQKIDVMKIDIEGAEYNALIGGKNVLKQVRFIMIECHTESEFPKINKFLIEELDKDVYCLKYLHKKTIDSPFSYQIVAIDNKYYIENGKIQLKK